MPIPITFAIFVVAICGIIFGAESVNGERRFEREVLMARDVVKACEQGAGADCDRARQVTVYGPDIPYDQIAMVDICAARAKDPTVPANVFLDRCRSAREKVDGLIAKAAAIGVPVEERPLGWRLVVVTMVTTGVTTGIALWVASAFRRRRRRSEGPASA